MRVPNNRTSHVADSSSAWPAPLQAHYSQQSFGPKSIRLSVQQCVQRLLHATANHPVEVALDPLVVNRDDIAQRTRCILVHGGSLLLSWLRLATSSSARFGAVALPNCAKDSVPHRESCIDLTSRSWKLTKALRYFTNAVTFMNTLGFVANHILETYRRPLDKALNHVDIICVGERLLVDCRQAILFLNWRRN
jgi:hypothetical protein